MPCWLSLTADGDRTRRAEPLTEAWAMAREVPEVLAVGVNCCTLETAAAAVAPAHAASGRPVVVYPNSGEGWDGARRDWSGSATFDPAAALGWVADGARLVGGCCRVTPAQIGELARLLRGAEGASSVR
ncbi:MAG: homocysteine S-methyltransferase family protein [Nocardioides sp.]